MFSVNWIGLFSVAKFALDNFPCVRSESDVFHTQTVATPPSSAYPVEVMLSEMCRNNVFISFCFYLHFSSLSVDEMAVLCDCQQSLTSSYE